MPRYLDTRGKSTIAIAICARCSVKYPWVDLRPDPNSPGLMCCPDGCRDQLDPWRLPPRPADRISLEWSRPDVSLSPGPQAVPVLPLQAAIGVPPPLPALSLIQGEPDTGLAAAPAVETIYQPVVWSASTYYRLGQQLVPTDPEGITGAGNEFWSYTCIVPGLSGNVAPAAWPTSPGVMVQTGDAWLVNSGLWMP